MLSLGDRNWLENGDRHGGGEKHAASEPVPISAMGLPTFSFAFVNRIVPVLYIGGWESG
jgi:hypothetical protein